jgi:hypothetical protein
MKLIPIGLAVAVISFVSLNQYGGQGATSFVRVLRTDQEYKSWRAANKPSKDVVLAVVYSALLLALTGFVLLKI